MPNPGIAAPPSASRTTFSAGGIHPGLPPVLAQLLTAPDGARYDAAWAEFIGVHTGLLLHASTSLEHDRDAAMDGYAFLLEALREDGCRRLRAYVPDSRTRFTTWLVVVARRLLLDRHRHRYGRPRSHDDAHRAEHAARRRLEDLMAVQLDPEWRSTTDETPDAALLQEEISGALHAALATLDSDDRSLLALRFEDARPVSEIAAILHLPTVFHVYRRLNAALGVLRRALARRGLESPDR